MHEPTIAHMDALTIHADFLRRMARALLQSNSDVEDLVQDTFVVALQKEPREKAAVRPWLVGILRNQMRNRFRGNKRRAAREESSARQEALPPTDELVAKEDIRRRVVDTLMSIDEPVRTTLILRFYEELPPREVAKRMDCPVETVRTRTRRGLEKMRRKLDEQHEGDRRAWMAAITPWAFPAGKAAGLAAVGGTATWKLGAAALLFVGIGLGARHLMRDTPLEKRTLATSDTHVVAGSEPDAQAGDGESPRPQLEGLGAEPNAVTSEAHLPAAKVIPPGHAVLAAKLKGIRRVAPGARVEVRGMHVTLKTSGARPMEYSAPVKASITSGRIRIDVEDLIAKKPPQALSLHVFMDGYEDYSHVVHLVPHAGDGSGDKAWFESPPPTPAAARRRLAATALEFELRSLFAGTAVTGHVETPKGTPIRNAIVNFYGRTEQGAARTLGGVKTDLKGRFVFRLDKERDIELIVKSQGWIPHYRKLRPAQDTLTDLGTLELDPGTTVEGQILGADMRGAALEVVASADAWPEMEDKGWRDRLLSGTLLVDRGVAHPTIQQATVDEEGRFRITGLAPGRRYTLELQGMVDGAILHPSTKALLTRATTDRPEFDLGRLARLTVRVAGEGGPKSLRVRGGEMGKLPRDSEGRYSAWVAPESNYEIDQYKLGPDYTSTRLIKVGSAGSHSEITLEPAARGLRLLVTPATRLEPSDSLMIAGYRVADTATGTALEQYNARTRRPDVLKLKGARAAKDARHFAVHGLAPGTYVLKVIPLSATKGAFITPVKTMTLHVVVAQEGWTEHTLALQPAGQLELSVRAQQFRKAHCQARLRRVADGVWIKPHFAVHGATRLYAPGLIQMATRYDCLEGLAPGDYDLEWQDGDGPVNRESFTIHVGQTTTVELDLDR